MANLLERIHGFLEIYVEFVNNLGSVTLLTLAAATVISGVYSLSCTGISTVTENLYQIQGLATVYLILVALYIRYLRRQEPQNPAPIQYPNVRQFLSTGYYVGSLGFFFTAFEPLGSVGRNIHVPVICVSSYLHLLILFAIMRLREDHGVSRGCLFASLFLVFPMVETNLERIIVVFAATLLSMISNLQLTPPLPPNQIPMLSQEEWLIQYRLEKSQRKSQR